MNDLKNYLTVGKLLKFIEENNIPHDAIVVTQRIEDVYFEGVDISGFGGCKETEDGIYPKGSKSSGWSVIKKEGEAYHNALIFNKSVEEKEFDVELTPYTPEELETFKSQYYPLWCPVLYDKEYLYLDAHY